MCKENVIQYPNEILFRFVNYLWSDSFLHTLVNSVHWKKRTARSVIPPITGKWKWQFAYLPERSNSKTLISVTWHQIIYIESGRHTLCNVQAKNDLRLSWSKAQYLQNHSAYWFLGDSSPFYSFFFFLIEVYDNHTHNQKKRIYYISYKVQCSVSWHWVFNNPSLETVTTVIEEGRISDSWVRVFMNTI